MFNTFQKYFMLFFPTTVVMCGFVSVALFVLPCEIEACCLGQGRVDHKHPSFLWLHKLMLLHFGFLQAKPNGPVQIYGWETI